MTIISQYRNGNYQVTIYEDGTKIRKFSDNTYLIPTWPESIDLKITNYCDAGCPYCHEQSTKKGQHANFNFTTKLLKGLPPGIEIAIGGGNPFSYQYLLRLLTFMKKQGLIANITINSHHLKEFTPFINYLRYNRLIYGLGVSYNRKYIDDILNIADNNTVIHVIAGLHDIHEIKKKLPNKSKLLILGYKQYGFGRKYFQIKSDISENLKVWRYWILTLTQKFHISFDNLAIKQMDLKRRLTDLIWDQFYMGDDGKFTMYIDAVKQEYAISSVQTRKKIEFPINIKDIFKDVRSQGIINK